MILSGGIDNDCVFNQSESLHRNKPTTLDSDILLYRLGNTLQFRACNLPHLTRENKHPNVTDKLTNSIRFNLNIEDSEKIEKISSF